MIVGNGKYYLYRHIRLDKNEPFYIGVGTKSKWGNLYKRATNTKMRNFMWLGVFNKTSIEVDILLESDDLSYISTKEEEFISLYGRKCNNTGTLVNIDKGGYMDRTFRKDNWRRSASERMTKMNKETAKKRIGTHHFSKYARKIYVYSLDGTFLSGYNSVVQCVDNFPQQFKYHLVIRKIDSNRSYMGYYFSSHKTDKLDTSNFIISKEGVDYGSKKICKISSNGEVIKIYNTMKQAEMENNLCKGTLYKSLKTKRSKLKKQFKYL